MLKRILQELASNHSYSQVDLSQHLGISPELLAQMMEDLGRKGYLTPQVGIGDRECGGCNKCQACPGCSIGTKSMPRSWVLTAKGRAAGKRYRQ